MKPAFRLSVFAAVLAASLPIGQAAFDYGPRPLPVPVCLALIAGYGAAVILAAAYAASAFFQD